MIITCPKCKEKFELSPEDEHTAYWSDIPLECSCGEIFSLVNFEFGEPDFDYDNDQVVIMRMNASNIIKKAISEMQGIAAAVIYDKKVDDSEIKLISGWLAEHKDFYNQWPICDLAKLMYEILEDGIITQDERKQLYDFLVTFAAGPKMPKHITGIFDEKPNIVFKGKTFLFTGKLAFGKRRTAEKAVIEQGGEILKGVSRKLDYLIVGELGSEAWSNGRFGTKIEQVIRYQKDGCPVKIILESDFVTHI